MGTIQRILNAEEANYTSNLNMENLKRKIEDLFNQKNQRLSGNLISENEFIAYDRLVVVAWSMPNLRRRSAYLKGRIVPTKNGVNIRLKVKPNPILPIFAVVSALSGVAMTLMHIIYTKDTMLFLIFGCVLIILGIVYYPLSTLLRNRLRNKVVNYLDLKKK